MTLFIAPFALVQLALFAWAWVAHDDLFGASESALADLALHLLAVPILAGILTLAICHRAAPCRAFLSGGPRFWRLVPLGALAAITSSTLSAAGVGALGDMWDESVPEWLIIALFAALLTWLCARFLPRHTPGHCIRCGYDRANLDGRCPECGEPDWERFAQRSAQIYGHRP